MRSKLFSLLVFSFLLFADVRALFHYFALEKEVEKRSKASLKYRMIISIWVKTMPDLFAEYQKKQMNLARDRRDEFPETVALKRMKARGKLRQKLLCPFEDKLKSVFKNKGKIYFLTEKLEGMSLIRTIYDAETCKELMKTKFSYLVASPSGQLIGLRRINLFNFLDHSFHIVKTLDLKDMLVQNLIAYNGRIFVQRRRLVPHIPAVQIRGKGVKEIFVKSRKAKGREANLLLQDTVFTVGEKGLYLAFVYPLQGTLEIYQCSLDGKPTRKFKLNFDEEYNFPTAWLNYEELLKGGVETIYAVSGLFAKDHFLYAILERNRINPPSEENLSHFIIRIDLKTREFSVISVPGLPVFCDGIKFYSVSLKPGKIFEIAIDEAKYKGGNHEKDF